MTVQGTVKPSLKTDCDLNRPNIYTINQYERSVDCKANEELV